MDKPILIYGSYGYTGELIVDLAAEEGAKPILAGRSADKVETQAALHGFEHRVFALDDPAEVDQGIEGVSVVLHCAGPFSRTAKPMAEACMRKGAHYLDITGEIEVFETMAALDAAAVKADVTLMPGTGFDVVPSDCLAAHLKSRMPDATELTLGINAIGKPSRGTATTMIENIHKGGLVRRDGKLTPVPSAWKMRQIDFGEGPVSTMTIPWGDVSTAFHSTGIPNIEVFMSTPPDLQRMAKLSRWFGWFFALGPIQSMLKKQIQSGPPGPSDAERASGRSLLWGEARDADGKSVESRLKTPEGYTLTARTAWEIAKRAVDGNIPVGFQTPSKAFGADFILEFGGVERTDL